MLLNWFQMTLLLFLWLSRCWFGKRPGVYTDYIYQGPMILVLLVRTRVGAWLGGGGTQWGEAGSTYSGLKVFLCLEVGGTGPGMWWAQADRGRAAGWQRPDPGQLSPCPVPHLPTSILHTPCPGHPTVCQITDQFHLPFQHRPHPHDQTPGIHHL